MTHNSKKSKPKQRVATRKQKLQDATKYEFIKTEIVPITSNSLDWLPSIKNIGRNIKGEAFYETFLMYGVNDLFSNKENMLVFAKVLIPNVKLSKKNSVVQTASYNASVKHILKDPIAHQTYSIKLILNHDEHIQRIRHMPQSPCVIATASNSKELSIFHYTHKHKEPNKDGEDDELTDSESESEDEGLDKTKDDIQDNDKDKFVDKHEEQKDLFRNKRRSNEEPQLRLQGHYAGCYGLDWNNHISGCLASASRDQTVNIWDILKTPSEDRVLKPVLTLDGHTGCINEVSWNNKDYHVCASASHDARLNFWDIRIRRCTESIYAHASIVNTVTFNPNEEFYVATGGGDNTVKLWDRRILRKSLYIYRKHEGEIISVKWSPFHRAVLATNSLDKRIHLLNFENFVDPNTSSNASNGFDSMFIHKEHASPVQEFAWHPMKPWVICSLSNDAVLQFWKVRDDLVSHIPTYYSSATNRINYSIHE